MPAPRLALIPVSGGLEDRDRPWRRVRRWWPAGSAPPLRPGERPADDVTHPAGHLRLDSPFGSTRVH